MTRANQAQLTAINEALRCLDFDCCGPADCDDAVVEAIDILLDARSRLTDKPWPELPHPAADPIGFAAWLSEVTHKQISDGRQ